MIDSTIDSIGLMTVVWLIVLWLFGRSLWKLVGLLVRDAEFMRLFGMVLLIVFSGGQIYHRLEGWGYLDSLYFTVITLTTIGYGDFSPQTALGKIFTILYILLGLGILGALIALISEKSHLWMASLRRHRRTDEHLTNQQTSDESL